MSSEFSYNRLKYGQYRLFKLDSHQPVDSQLSGQLITLPHSRPLDLSRERIKSSLSNLPTTFDDIFYLELRGSGYEALSYVWGSPDNQQQLLLRASEKVWKGKVLTTKDPGHNQGRISITHNLHELLIELRNRRYDDFIWIDAICINQHDATEKSRQIPMMRYIYEEAKRVLIWLGPGDDITRGAFRIIPNLTKIFEGIDPKTYTFDPNDLKTFNEKGLPPPDSNIWSAICRIMAHPWFTRLWTLQEISLPKKADLLCGSETMDWDIFATFAYRTRSFHYKGWSLRSHSGLGNTNTGWDSCRNIHMCRKMRQEAWGMPLDPLLGIIRRRRVTVPVDMVFGIMGLMAFGDVRRLGPIDIDWSAPEVFVRFAQFYMHQEPQECILNYANSTWRDPGLPSWCPDFSQPEETAILGSTWYYDYWLGLEVQEQRFRAGWRLSGHGAIPLRKHRYLKMTSNVLRGRTAVHGIYDTSDPRFMSVIPGSCRLRVHGMAIDAVAVVIECNPGVECEQPFTLNALAQTMAWEKQCLELAQRTLGTNDDTPPKYYRTMVANQIPGLGHENVYWDVNDAFPFADAFRGWRDYLANVVASGQVSEPNTMDLRAYYIAYMMIRCTKKRCFFATRNGHIGLGPSDTKVGDELCVLRYCPTPYLLRPDQSSSDKVLIGESYVHGLMYGEALNMLDRGEVVEREWVIK